jgi:2',3'-cyclic-nucleotide 2'-phosphodiesterase (5'-nucleotidase family)
VRPLLTLFTALLGATGPDRGVTIAFSGDSWGEIEPCGCPKVKLGGLARQAGVVDAWQRLGQPFLLLDSGDLLARPEAGAAEREETALRAALAYDVLAKMGLTAAVPGEADLSLGVPFLRDLAARAGITLLAANLQDRSGASPFAGSTVLSVGGLTVGVVGLLSPSLCPKELKASSPASAAREQIAWMGKVDLLVALAHQPPEEDDELARQVPFDLLIAAHGGVPVVASQIDGHTLRVRNGNSARFIGRIDLDLGKPGTTGSFADGNALLRTWLASGDWQKTPGPFVAATPGDARRFAAALVPLEEGLPLDTAVAARIAAYRAQADARERARLATGGAAAASVDNSAYAGDTRCATCHAQAYEAWKGSLHAAAYETLVRAGHSLDTSCVGCHTTGYGRPGGFEHPAQVGFLKEVQCEVCHGPGKAHVVDPRSARLSVSSGEQACRGCHSTERSPAFNYASYLARIAHH